MQTANLPKDNRPELIAEHIRDMDLTDLDLWPALDALSTHTTVEGADIGSEGFVISPDGSFTGVFNIYVNLQYGKNDEDGFSTSDSFLAQVNGHFDGDDPIIDSSKVDTSSFYEEDPDQID